MPTSEVITELTEIGAGDDAGVPPMLADPGVAWSLLQGDKASWAEAAEAMPEDRLRFLIRGLVLYSKMRGAAALGGSVSPVISILWRSLANFWRRTVQRGCGSR